MWELLRADVVRRQNAARVRQHQRKLLRPELKELRRKHTNRRILRGLLLQASRLVLRLLRPDRLQCGHHKMPQSLRQQHVQARWHHCSQRGHSAHHGARPVRLLRDELRFAAHSEPSVNTRSGRAAGHIMSNPLVCRWRAPPVHTSSCRGLVYVLWAGFCRHADGLLINMMQTACVRRTEGRSGRTSHWTTIEHEGARSEVSGHRWSICVL